MNIRLLPPMAIAAASVILLTACASGGAGSGPEVSGRPVAIDAVGTISTDADLAARVPASLRSSGLRVVTAAPYPPFEQFNADNKLEGVDVDFASAIAAKLGVEAHVANVDFSGIIPSLQSGNSDMAMAGMADNTERQAVLDFIDYSTEGGSQLVIAKSDAGSLRTFADLCGKAVGVEKGSTYAENVTFNQTICAAAQKEPVRVVNQASQGAAMLAIQSGSISALMTGGISAAVLANAQPDKVTVMKDAQAPDGFFNAKESPKNYTGIGILKSTPDVTAVVFDAVKDLGSDGTTEKIFQKWGIREHAVIPAVKNQGE